MSLRQTVEKLYNELDAEKDLEKLLELLKGVHIGHGRGCYYTSVTDLMGETPFEPACTCSREALIDEIERLELKR